MRDDHVYWRLIYGFPIVLSLMSLRFIVTYFKEPSIIDLVQAHSDEAMAQVQRVYRDVDDYDELIRKLRKTTNKENSKVSIRAALSDKKYRKASWNALIMGWASQTSGIITATVYITPILIKMK